ncbi:MAG: DUF1501 domain-containing protein [Steroidobacteraceae bacterium]
MQRALAATADTSGYKALVCVFLVGGNNSFNWVVPTSSTAYATYKSSRSNLALAQSSLLALNGTASDGNSYGFHPGCPELRTLFNAGNAAIISNVGTLVQPTTPAQARAQTVATPPQLFSHVDQQTLWQTCIANSAERYGWAGRVADLLSYQGVIANLSTNINVGGANYWQEGRATIPYVLGDNGAPVLSVTANNTYRSGTRQRTAIDILNQAFTNSNPLVREYASIQRNADDKVSFVNSAFGAAGNLNTDFPSVPGDSNIGGQLRQVARTIKARSQIGDSRQIFFISMSGFDTHNSELATQATLLNILSKNLNTFWNALGEIGAQSNVTTFTASDFGRSLGSNGDGSDHGWGGHAMVMGGAVQGARIYGTMPSLAINGPDDVGNGRIVPTTSTDQYAATLAKWFGVADADLDVVFPNLRNFATRNLGFLG